MEASTSTNHWAVHQEQARPGRRANVPVSEVSNRRRDLEYWRELLLTALYLTGADSKGVFRWTAGRSQDGGSVDMGDASECRRRLPNPDDNDGQGA